MSVDNTSFQANYKEYSSVLYHILTETIKLFKIIYRIELVALTGSDMKQTEKIIY